MKWGSCQKRGYLFLLIILAIPIASADEPSCQDCYNVLSSSNPDPAFFVQCAERYGQRLGLIDQGFSVEQFCAEPGMASSQGACTGQEGALPMNRFITGSVGDNYPDAGSFGSATVIDNVFYFTKDGMIYSYNPAENSWHTFDSLRVQDVLRSAGIANPPASIDSMMYFDSTFVVTEGGRFWTMPSGEEYNIAGFLQANTNNFGNRFSSVSAMATDGNKFYFYSGRRFFAFDGSWNEISIQAMLGNCADNVDAMAYYENKLYFFSGTNYFVKEMGAGAGISECQMIDENLFQCSVGDYIDYNGKRYTLNKINYIDLPTQNSGKYSKLSVSGAGGGIDYGRAADFLRDYGVNLGDEGTASKALETPVNIACILVPGHCRFPLSVELIADGSTGARTVNIGPVSPASIDNNLVQVVGYTGRNVLFLMQLAGIVEPDIVLEEPGIGHVFTAADLGFSVDNANKGLRQTNSNSPLTFRWSAGIPPPFNLKIYSPNRQALSVDNIQGYSYSLSNEQITTLLRTENFYNNEQLARAFVLFDDDENHNIQTTLPSNDRPLDYYAARSMWDFIGPENIRNIGYNYGWEVEAVSRRLTASSNFLVSIDPVCGDNTCDPRERSGEYACCTDCGCDSFYESCQDSAEDAGKETYQTCSTACTSNALDVSSRIRLGVNVDGNFEWRSSDEGIASVEGDGRTAVVTAVDEGNVVISAASQDGSANPISLKIGHVNYDDVSLVFYDDDLVLDVGDRLMMRATQNVLGSDFRYNADSFTWEVSDMSVLRLSFNNDAVGYNGVMGVEGLAPGEADVIATSRFNPDKQSRLHIIVSGTQNPAIRIEDIELTQCSVNQPSRACLPLAPGLPEPVLKEDCQLCGTDTCGERGMCDMFGKCSYDIPCIIDDNIVVEQGSCSINKPVECIGLFEPEEGTASNCKTDDRGNYYCDVCSVCGCGNYNALLKLGDDLSLIGSSSVADGDEIIEAYNDIAIVAGGNTIKILNEDLEEVGSINTAGNSPLLHIASVAPPNRYWQNIFATDSESKTVIRFDDHLNYINSQSEFNGEPLVNPVDVNFGDNGLVSIVDNGMNEVIITNMGLGYLAKVRNLVNPNFAAIINRNLFVVDNNYNNLLKFNIDDDYNINLVSEMTEINGRSFVHVADMFAMDEKLVIFDSGNNMLTELDPVNMLVTGAININDVANLDNAADVALDSGKLFLVASFTGVCNNDGTCAQLAKPSSERQMTEPLPEEPTAQPVACRLINVHWSDSTAVIGDDVDMIIETDGCIGGTIGLRIFEQDSASCEILPGDDEVYQGSVVVNNNIMRLNWAAEMPSDGFMDLCAPPEFYFNAVIEDEELSSINAESNGILEVANSDVVAEQPQATCSDRIQNQDEQGIDCGGICGTACTGCNNNRACEPGAGENSDNCNSDCYCGDSLCDGSESGDAESDRRYCPYDCPNNNPANLVTCFNDCYDADGCVCRELCPGGRRTIRKGETCGMTEVRDDNSECGQNENRLNSDDCYCGDNVCDSAETGVATERNKIFCDYDCGDGRVPDLYYCFQNCRDVDGCRCPAICPVENRLVSNDQSCGTERRNEAPDNVCDAGAGESIFNSFDCYCGDDVCDAVEDSQHLCQEECHDNIIGEVLGCSYPCTDADGCQCNDRCVEKGVIAYDGECGGEDLECIIVTSTEESSDSGILQFYVWSSGCNENDNARVVIVNLDSGSVVEELSVDLRYSLSQMMSQPHSPGRYILRGISDDKATESAIVVIGRPPRTRLASCNDGCVSLNGCVCPASGLGSLSCRNNEIENGMNCGGDGQVSSLSCISLFGTLPKQCYDRDGCTCDSGCGRRGSTVQFNEICRPNAPSSIFR